MECIVHVGILKSEWLLNNDRIIKTSHKSGLDKIHRKTFIYWLVVFSYLLLFLILLWYSHISDYQVKDWWIYRKQSLISIMRMARKIGNIAIRNHYPSLRRSTVVCITLIRVRRKASLVDIFHPDKLILIFSAIEIFNFTKECKSKIPWRNHIGFLR